MSASGQCRTLGRRLFRSADHIETRLIECIEESERHVFLGLGRPADPQCRRCSQAAFAALRTMPGERLAPSGGPATAGEDGYADEANRLTTS